MLRSIREAKVKDKKVLLRVDFNVPLKQGRIIDDTRIKAVLPTIKYLSKNKAKVILISHLGSPAQVLATKFDSKNSKISRDLDSDKIWAGDPTKRNRKFSLKPIAKYLKIKFIDDCLGRKVGDAVVKMKPGEIILLENLRFYPGEEKNDSKFANQLANLADIYVNEAFSVCHRQHSSVSAITKFLPSYAGFLLEQEVKELNKILKNRFHSFVAIIGGAKISTKIKVIKNLLKKVDFLLIAGALANNFFKAQEYEVGKSLIEKEMLAEAKRLLEEKKLILPLDVKTDQRKERDSKKVSQDEKILDIGPKTIKLFSNYIKRAKMIVWNGPMGMFEKKGFDKGTKEIAKIILNNKKAKIIIGGGETIAALGAQNKKGKNIFISTGGGAMLKFLEGKVLPGIKPLMVN